MDVAFAGGAIALPELVEFDVSAEFVVFDGVVLDVIELPDPALLVVTLVTAGEPHPTTNPMLTKPAIAPMMVLFIVYTLPLVFLPVRTDT